MNVVIQFVSIGGSGRRNRRAPASRSAPRGAATAKGTLRAALTSMPRVASSGVKKSRAGIGVPSVT